MKTKQENIRHAMIKKLKDNTIFQNQYDQVHIEEGDTRICIGSAASCSNEVLLGALKKNGFIC